MMTVTTVVIVDDDTFVRSTLTTMLTALGLRVVGEADDGDGAVAAVLTHRPDVVLMDLRMQRMQGVEATAAVRALPDPPAVIALTSFDTDDSVVRALRAGASGYVFKDASPDQIKAGISAVVAGDAVLAPRAARQVIDHLIEDPAAAGRDAARARVATLTDRELDVARGVAEGLTNAAIGERLFLAEGTVKAHVAHVLTKLDLENRVQLAALVASAALPDR